MSAHIEVRFTPSPESAEASFGRDVPVRLALHETADGAITIDIRIDDEAGHGLGLGALVFDFADHEILGGLHMDGPRLRGRNVSSGRVRAAGDDARGYDCGVRFERDTRHGMPAPRATALQLAHDSLCLTIDDLAGRDFALHLVPTAANRASGHGLVIEGRLPGRPARQTRDAGATDGSIFGGVFEQILPLMGRRAAQMGDAA